MNTFSSLSKTLVLGAAVLSLGFVSNLSARGEHEDIKQLKRDGLHILSRAHKELLEYRHKLVEKMMQLHEEFEKNKELDRPFDHHLLGKKIKIHHMLKGTNCILAKLYQGELNLGASGKCDVEQMGEGQHEGQIVKRAGHPHRSM